ncbi:MAG: HypC/HybG/HupF family hydrogenase formation chaperone [Acidimicrobiales bacterium]
MSTVSASPAVGAAPTDGESALAVASLRLAKDLAGGAALWCVSSWPHHARHLAVEFVHPVLVGARAVPAVAVDLDAGCAALRTATRPGDVVVLLGPGTDEHLADIASRCPAWGVRCLWLAVGADPPEGLGDHVARVADADDSAPYDGTVVRSLHVLWELVHVAFDHLGPMPAPATEDDTHSCPTCADAADVGEVASATPGSGTAHVRIGGTISQVDVTLVGPVAVADLLLVHAGVALGAVEPQASRS